MNPKQWRDMTIGKSYDIDKSYGAQCWDYFAYFLSYFNIPVSSYCSITGYVCDLWTLRDKYNYSAYFDYIYNANYLKDGDIVFWNKGSSHAYSHVAFYMHDTNGKVVELGQNQGYPYVTEKETTWDIMGALRWKGWYEIPYGASEAKINGHSYSLYRQNPQTEKAVVLSAGLNKVKPIKELDADAYVMSKITGANFFQLRTDKPDEQEYGTTYGDISSPLNDVWRELPNQNSTLYFDLETGMFGDCTGIHINKEHNVYSPGIVYPDKGNYQYGTFIGIDCVNIVSRYTFCIRFTDGSYCLGLANQDLTPKTIANDFRTTGIVSIAFLDGGGSAQMMRYIAKDHRIEYTRDTGQEVPSAVAIISTQEYVEEPVVAPSDPPVSDEPQKDEGEPMEDTKPQEPAEMKPVEGWTDPEPQPQTNIMVQRIAALLSVKSLITIFLTVIFGLLVLRGEELPDKFVSIYTMCISFFFGYQFKKAENKE